jgi:hypothetical protein
MAINTDSKTNPPGGDAAKEGSVDQAEAGRVRDTVAAELPLSSPDVAAYFPRVKFVPNQEKYGAGFLAVVDNDPKSPSVRAELVKADPRLTAGPHTDQELKDYADKLTKFLMDGNHAEDLRKAFFGIGNGVEQLRLARMMEQSFRNRPTMKMTLTAKDDASISGSKVFAFTGLGGQIFDFTVNAGDWGQYRSYVKEHDGEFFRALDKRASENDAAYCDRLAGLFCQQLGPNRDGIGAALVLSQVSPELRPHVLSMASSKFGSDYHLAPGPPTRTGSSADNYSTSTWDINWVGAKGASLYQLSVPTRLLDDPRLTKPLAPPEAVSAEDSASDPGIQWWLRHQQETEQDYKNGGPLLGGLSSMLGMARRQPVDQTPHPGLMQQSSAMIKETKRLQYNPDVLPPAGPDGEGPDGPVTRTAEEAERFQRARQAVQNLKLGLDPYGNDPFKDPTYRKEMNEALYSFAMNNGPAVLDAASKASTDKDGNVDSTKLRFFLAQLAMLTSAGGPWPDGKPTEIGPDGKPRDRDWVNGAPMPEIRERVPTYSGALVNAVMPGSTVPVVGRFLAPLNVTGGAEYTGGPYAATINVGSRFLNGGHEQPTITKENVPVSPFAYNDLTPTFFNFTHKELQVIAKDILGFELEGQGGFVEIALQIYAPYDLQTWENARQKMNQIMDKNPGDFSLGDGLRYGTTAADGYFNGKRNTYIGNIPDNKLPRTNPIFSWETSWAYEKWNRAQHLRREKDK